MAISARNVISKYAIWESNEFTLKEKLIQFNERTVVKIIACGFCGTDKHSLQELAISGISLGHEILAEIVYLGSQHKVVGGQELEIGDRVIVIPGKNCGCCTHCLSHTGQSNLCQHRTAHGWGYFSHENFFAAGGFSTHIELMDDVWLAPVPKNISNDIAVLAEPLAIAVRAVDRAISGTRADRDLGSVVAMRAAVVGLGPIGYLIAYVLQSMGADVIGFDASEWRCKYLTDNLGFHAIHLPLAQAEDIGMHIENNSSIKDFDTVFECGGTTSAFVASLLAARKAGKVIVLGNYIQSADAEIDPAWICRKELDVIGFVLANPFTYKKVFNLLATYPLTGLDIVTNKIKLSELEKLLPLNHHQEMKVIIENDF